MPTELESAREALELQAIEAQTAAIKHLSREVGLSESWYDDDPQTSSWQSIRSRPRNPLSMAAPTAFASIRDNSEGRYWPFYDTEQDVWRTLAATRNLASFDSTAIGAGQALQAYVLCGEWKANVTVDEQPPEESQTARKVQRTLDKMLDRWEWWETSLPSIFRAGIDDGEQFIGLYPEADSVVVDMLLPEQVKRPSNTYALNEWLGEPDSTWYFGVHCRKASYAERPDYARPLGYHIVEDDAGTHWDYLPSWPQPGTLEDSRCCYHWKRNAPIRAARGVSDYYPILADLERVYKLYRNSAEGAAIQAAIAMVIQRESGSRTAAINDIAGNAIDAVNAVTQRGGGATTYTRRFDPGCVIETDRGSTYNPGPMGQPSGQTYMDIAQALTRSRISIRWNMPEFIIAGDASNNNYSSALVAESPFVKYCERQQTLAKGMTQSVVWRALRMLYIAGRFPEFPTWQAFEAAVDVDIVAGEVATQDRAAQTTRMTALFDKGIITGQHWAQVEGVPEEEVREPTPTPPQGMAIPAATTESIRESWNRIWRGYP